MPKCGSQITLCDLPIRFDTYKGCSHNCKYCFTYNKYDISNIKKMEGVEALKNFIQGKREHTTRWCDWDIPLHWGGMSDPFQRPAEKKYRSSLECLKIFNQTKYPFVVSTKSTLPAEGEYYELLKGCNFVFQVSMVSPLFDKLELGAPTFDERLEMLEKMSKIAKRVSVRIQPYIPSIHKSIISYLEDYKKAGVYGVIVEGMKYNKKVPNTVKVGGDFCHYYKTLKKNFLDIKERCHDLGLVFLCAENRLRHISDSLCCCGVEGLEGFLYNKANLNHYLYDKENYIFSGKMGEAGTAGQFTSGFAQSTIQSNVIKKMSMKECMGLCENDKGMIGIFKNRD